MEGCESKVVTRELERNNMARSEFLCKLSTRQITTVEMYIIFFFNFLR